MKLDIDNFNYFKVKIVFNNEEYTDNNFTLYYTVKNNKRFYIINSTCPELHNFFSSEPIEGIKGFKQHIVSNDIFYLVYNEKHNKLDLFNWKLSLFIIGHKI